MAVRFKLFTLLLFSFVFSIGAAPPKFYNINAKFGISFRNAISVCEDNNGFIWASYRSGIIRFTDDDYRMYELLYENADVINLNLVIKKTWLYAYTNNGQIYIYDDVFDHFDLYLNLRKSENNQNLSINNLLIDDNGILWISTNAGIYKYEANELTRIDINSTNRFSITWFDNRQLILVYSGGILLFDTQTLQSRIVFENQSQLPLFASSMFYDASYRKLWIGTISRGIICFDFTTGTISGKLESTFPRQPVLTISENTDSTLLFGVDGQGIWELYKKNDQLIGVYKENADNPFSLHGNGVYDIYCDKNKRVWICTVTGGLSYYDQASPVINQVVHAINNNNSLVNNDVNSIVEDSKGRLWFATNNGICRWDVATNQWKSFYNNKLEQSQVFLSISEDKRGRIWAGSYASGVYVLDDDTGRELAHYSRNTMDPPRISNFVMDVFRDSEGDLWIGSNNGQIACFLQKQDSFRFYSMGSVSQFAELAPGQILFGGGDGLSLIDKNSGEIKTIIPDLLINDLILRGEEIWICTMGEGLIRFDYENEIQEKFTTSTGLPSNFINSILYAEGFLWLGTENGLCRINPIDHRVTAFDGIVPLSGISYNRGATYITRTGQLAWGTNNGAVFFDARVIKETPLTGRIFFQDLYISGRSIRNTPNFELNSPVDSIQSLKLNYSRNNINLELLPVSTPAGSKFSWKLEGFDQEWTLPSENRILTYTNIPSGSFELSIRLYDNSLSRIIAERKITLKLTPPFWKTVWFFVVIFTVVAGLIFLYFLYYLNRLRQIHTEEKIRFFTNTAHDIRTALTLIKAPVEELIHENNLTRKGKHYLQLAIEQARRLSSVVTQLMDFQKVDIGKDQFAPSMVDLPVLIKNRILMFESFAKSRDVELVFTVNRKHFNTAADEAKMEKIIDNLISNAIKYSHPNSQVHVDLNCDISKWSLQVKDYGIGISKKAQRQLFKEFYRGENAVNTKIVGSGIGLLLVKNYVSMHGGAISYESQENIGSTFRISIPFKKVSEKKKSTHTDPDFQLPETSIHYVITPETENDNKPPKELKILIVEDNEDLLEFMNIALEDEFHVSTARDGEFAWNYISKHLPDLVVSDVMMPKINGFDLCRLMKSTYETSHIPLILLTALSEKTEQLHGLGLGADDYLTKPFDINLLIQRIKTIVRNRETIREKALKMIKGDALEPVFDNELNNEFLKKILDVAHQNIANSGFSKDDFAASMNVSPSLLYKKIKAFTGQSPTDFIKTVRLNSALEMLQSKKYSVTEVSELCGFTSVAYFSTVFRKFFGKSPKEITK